MSGKSGQRFIKENRAPRVHIEYEVDNRGSRRKVELPFVMGVMSDLYGKSNGTYLETVKDPKTDKTRQVRRRVEDRGEEKPAMDKRQFEEFDMDNFEEKMQAIAPRAMFMVENTLTGGGKLGVDLTFKKIDDFTPGAIAKNVPELAKLLEARQQLNDLMLYMDGKDGAQRVLDKLIKDKSLRAALASAAFKPDTENEG